jgi:hypothetical protein
MALDATTTATTPSFTTLPGSGSYADLLGMIGSLVNFELPGVQEDVKRWLSWTLAGGTRPKLTKRTTCANGINGYATTQDAVCAVLDRYAGGIDWDNPDHFKLIERATRPLPGTTPLV